MTSMKYKGFRIATLMAVGSTLAFASHANATTLKVTIESLAPANGAVVTPLWFGLHDGSFDSFDSGSAASTGIMHLAEDGIVGLEGTVPGVVDYLLANGLNPAVLPPPDNTIAGIFANSAAGANGGVQGIITDVPIGIGPGQTFSSKIRINDATQNRYFSYGAMFFPSNDAFIANGNPLAWEIFDGSGKFKGADFIIGRNDIWDAGTEVNTETPDDVPFTFDRVIFGTDENGVITPHAGFLPAGSGGVLDFNNGQFANADFTNNPNYQLARITVTQVPEPSAILGLFTIAGLGLLGRQLKKHKE